MRRVAWIVGVGLLLALCWCFRDALTNSSLDSAGTAQERSGAVAQANPTNASGPAVAPVEEELPSRHVVSLPDPIDPADAARMVQVRVLDREALPIPGVEVWYEALPGPDMDRARLEAVLSDPVGELPRMGRKVRTDERGIARWPWLSSPSFALTAPREWWVSAQHLADCGTVRFSMSTRPSVVHDLHLRSDQTLAVQVYRADGKPAVDVDVGLMGWPSSSSFTLDGLRGLSRSSTDAQGIATFRHLQESITGLRHRGATIPIRVAIEGPALDVHVDLDAAALPAAMPVLQLQGVGEVELRLHYPDGWPLGAGEFAGLTLAGRSEGLRVCLVKTPGQLVIRSVPLGERWMVLAPFFLQQVVEFDGPTEPNQRVVCEVKGEAQRVLVGQLVLNGQPARDLKFLTKGLGQADRTMWTTDADGRFHVVDRCWVAEELEELTQLELVIERAEGDGDSLSARWSGHIAGTRQVHDLGPLPLQSVTSTEPGVQSGPVLCSGVVQASLPDLSMVELYVVPDGARRRAPLEPEFDCATGRFTFFGDVPIGKVVARASGHGDASVSFTRGQTDLFLTLVEQPALEATFRVPDADLLSCLSFALVHCDPDREMPPSNPPDSRKQRDGVEQCRWSDLRPGRYRLEVTCAGLSKPLLSLPNLDVPPSGMCLDARLQNIVLQEPEMLRIEVRGPERRVDRVEVHALSGGQARECKRSPDGRFLVAHDGPVDLIVGATGCRVQRIAGVTTDQIVTLQRGIPVTLRIDTSALSAWQQINVNMQGADATSVANSYRDGGRLLPGTSESEFLVPWPGKFSVSWILDRQFMSELKVEPEEITVPEAGGTFSIKLLAADADK
jgi:hypothetical protein